MTPTLTTDGRRSNIGPYLLSNPEARQPTHDLLQDGNMVAYMAIHPAHWAPADALPNMEGYGRNWISEDDELSYIRAGKDGAKAYFERFKDTYRATQGQIHAWMSTWAFVFHDEEFAAPVGRVPATRVAAPDARAHDYLAGVGRLKTYQFEPGEITLAGAGHRRLRLSLSLSESDAPT